MNADQVQFEEYWRKKIGNEILEMIVASQHSLNKPSAYDVYEKITKLSKIN